MSLNDPLCNRMLGCFFGGIAGDAYGSAYEFKGRDTYEVSPDMEETVFGLPPGSFTDDSSMMLCLAVSLTENENFSPVDQMERYVRWRRDGYMSSCPKRGCFDIGRTTSMAISKFHYAQEQFSRNNDDGFFSAYHGLDGEYDSGNGGIMRLAPVPIVYHYDVEAAGHFSMLSSKVTHASAECLEAATLMGEIIAKLLQGQGKREASLKAASKQDDQHKQHNQQEHNQQDSDKENVRFSCPSVQSIYMGTYLEKTRAEIKTSGYVIDSLEAALWAFHLTETFEDGMMLLAGCGSDVDTVCCIYGQIAGAFYGYFAIPKRWVNSLQRITLLAETGMNLVKTATQSIVKG